jgi:hypothetical protein
VRRRSGPNSSIVWWMPFTWLNTPAGSRFPLSDSAPCSGEFDTTMKKPLYKGGSIFKQFQRIPLLGCILRNLVTNAMRYTEPGGRVLIGCRRKWPEIRIDVYDTGIGIPEDQLSRIFESAATVWASGSQSFAARSRCLATGSKSGRSSEQGRFSRSTRPPQRQMQAKTTNSSLFAGG